MSDFCISICHHLFAENLLFTCHIVHIIMAAPTQQELVLIKEFRERLGKILKTDENKSDHFLIRWIRARDHDLDKAEELLRKDLIWRAENKADDALNMECDPFFSKNFPYWIKGFSKEGHPVLEIPVGTWDVRLAMSRPDGESEFTNYTTKLFENLQEKIRERNKDKKEAERVWPITQMIGICDWNGYSYSQLMNWKALQSLLSFGTKYEAHYPEIFFRGFYINCPSIFPIIFAMIKPLLAPATLKKIFVYGTKREEWEPAIREWIDPDQLGIQFGGVCEDRKIENLGI